MDHSTSLAQGLEDQHSSWSGEDRGYQGELTLSQPFNTTEYGKVRRVRPSLPNFWERFMYLFSPPNNENGNLHISQAGEGLGFEGWFKSGEATREATNVPGRQLQSQLTQFTRW